MAPNPPNPSNAAADDGNKEKEKEENSGGALDDKTERSPKRSSGSFEETIFERISTPQKPATAEMPHRWEKENEKDIEQMRKVYRDEMPLRGKMTQSDFSALNSQAQDTGQSERSGKTRKTKTFDFGTLPQSQDTGQSERDRCKSPISPERVDTLEPRSCAVKAERQKTVEVEPEPRTEAPLTETFERSERSGRGGRKKLARSPDRSSTYFTAMTTPHRTTSSTSSTSSTTSSVERSCRSQKGEKKASYYNFKDIASSVASHTKNVFGGFLKKENADENDTSRRSERKHRHVRSNYGNDHKSQQPLKNSITSTPSERSSQAK